MNVRTTMSMLLAVCIAAALLFILEDRSALESHVGDGSVPLIELGDVTELSMRDKTNSLSFIKRGQLWYVRHPIKSRADSGKIEQIVEQLNELRRQEVITSEQRSHRGLDLLDYGLVEPRMRILLRHSLGLTELMIGNDSPLGDRLYVKMAGSDLVFSTLPGVMGLKPGAVNTYRDRFVLRGSPTHTSRIELHRAGGSFVRAIREHGEWRLQAPVKDWADSRRIEQLLNALYALQVKGFVWDPKVVESGAGEVISAGLESEEMPRVESYGLAIDEARARVQVWLDGDLVNSEVIFGKTLGPDAAVVYAKRREIESVYAVDARLLDLLSVDVDTLRSRDIFRVDPAEVRYLSIQRGERKLIVSKGSSSQWQIEEPGKWSADQQVVEALIQGLSKWRAVAFVEAAGASNMVAQLDPPHCVMQLSRTVPVADLNPGSEAAAVNADPLVPVSIAIGRWQEGDTHVPLRVDEETTLRLVSIEMIWPLPANPTDALVYRQRGMLSIPPAAVRRLVLESGSLSQEVVQDEAGTWVPVDGTNAVNEEAIRDILFFAADMRADRIEALATNDLSAYGLDAAQTTLTFGLSGEAGIQKSLLLGASAGQQGVFAMVQGRDVVFVLPALLVERLSSGLLIKE